MTDDSNVPDAASPRARVLMVEDEPSARRALAMLLAEEGYEVETASSGEEALEMIGASHPDVLLTDVRMPGMTGIELLSRARAADPSLPVVVMTAFGTVHDAVHAMRAGADYYLTKPIDFDELRLVLGRVLEQRALRREASQLRERVRVEHPGAPGHRQAASALQVTAAHRSRPSNHRRVFDAGDVTDQVAAEAVPARDPARHRQGQRRERPGSARSSRRRVPERVPNASHRRPR